jgi:hypothetical protein
MLQFRNIAVLTVRFLDVVTFTTLIELALGPGVYSASNRNEYQKHKNNVSGE